MSPSLLLLTAAQPKTLGDTAETEPPEQLIDTETTEDTVDQTAQSEPVEQLAHETQHTGQQQADGRDDLEQWLGEQAPERVQLLLGVRHVRQAFLRVVDRLDDAGRQLLEAFGHAVLFGCSFA